MLIKKLMTLANFLTIVSIVTGVAAYFFCPELLGGTSLATGIAAFGVGIAL